MRKKAISLLLAFIALWICTHFLDARANAAAIVSNTPGLSSYITGAKGAVLMDADTGRVLFAENEDARLPMASTTKIMTALLALEQDDPETLFVVDAKALRVEGSSMGLREGDLVTLRTLAYGMLLPSGNDAAGAAAARIAGNEASAASGGAVPPVTSFAALMNERARELNMLDTHFVTPSGLHDKRHYSTAYDMALLTRAALQNPLFAEICAQSSAKVSFGNPPTSRWLQNHNRLLRSYSGTVGVKTGFTDAAGRCLVSAAERNGIRLIAVTLNCSDDWNVHKNLYDRAFAALRTEIPVMPIVSVPVTGGGLPAVDAAWDELPALALLPGETLEIRVTAAKLLFAPVRAGSVVGGATVYCGPTPLCELTLAASGPISAVTEETKGIMDRIEQWLS